MNIKMQLYEEYIGKKSLMHFKNLKNVLIKRKREKTQESLIFRDEDSI